jgi:hypothetical protein
MSEKPIVAMNREDRDDINSPVIGYMCLIEYEYEVGAASGGSMVYPSVDDLKKNHLCVDSCGVVEVEVRARRIVQEPKEEEWVAE